MVRCKGVLSMREWQWPHQVALPAYRCHGHNYVTIRPFCEPLSLSHARAHPAATTKT